MFRLSHFSVFASRGEARGCFACRTSGYSRRVAGRAVRSLRTQPQTEGPGPGRTPRRCGQLEMFCLSNFVHVSGSRSRAGSREKRIQKANPKMIQKKDRKMIQNRWIPVRKRIQKGSQKDRKSMDSSQETDPKRIQKGSQYDLKSMDSSQETDPKRIPKGSKIDGFQSARCIVCRTSST